MITWTASCGSPPTREFCRHGSRRRSPIRRCYSSVTGSLTGTFRVLFRALVEYLAKSSSRSHVSVQLLPVPADMTAEQKENVQKYFDKHFGKLQIRVFWGTCRDFVSELSQRWEAFNGSG